MILLIDNYDSFSFNLVQYAGEMGCEVIVKRNDVLSAQDALALSPAGIIVSPGPGRPEDAGISVALIRAARGVCPVLGVCLGHQAIGLAFGARIVGAPELVHGKASRVRHDGRGILAGLPSPFMAGRYHSLVVAREGLPPELDVTAETEDGLIMGLKLRGAEVWGVQFHPESILTERGKDIVRKFVDLCGAARTADDSVPPLAAAGPKAGKKG